MLFLRELCHEAMPLSSDSSDERHHTVGYQVKTVEVRLVRADTHESGANCDGTKSYSATLWECDDIWYSLLHSTASNCGGHVGDVFGAGTSCQMSRRT